MPRVNDRLTWTVVYLYPSQQAARDAVKAGGTGFIVQKRTHYGWFDYVVTNRHVVEEMQSPYVRINTHDKKDPIEVFEGEWTLSDSDDIAVSEMPLHRAHYAYQPIHVEYLITQKNIDDLRIGLGDDLFLVGRFLNHDGKQRNIPVVRFGTIAMMPNEPIVYEDKLAKRQKQQESFLIEIRTIPGFSGSPVFVHMPWDTRQKDPHFRPSPLEKQISERDGFLEKLLGIEWCRLKGETAKSPMINGATFDIQVTSGMSACIPAWKITDLIETNDTLMKRRADHERKYSDSSPVEFTIAPAEDIQITTPKEGEPITIPVPTEEQFERDLNKAVRRKKD